MSEGPDHAAEFSIDDLEEMLILLKECYPDETETMEEIRAELRRLRAAQSSGEDRSGGTEVVGQ